ncbi:MAG: sensor histidine kinase [Clostridiaceae bacterium]|nr:sensor histidine kinase [Clostridiaceae bacterium]
MQKNHAIISASAFIILIIFIFTSLALITGLVGQEVVDASPGYVDLSDFNFSQKLANISHTSFLYYREDLYTPEDFKLGYVKTEPSTLDDSSARFDPGNYGTYRILVKLPDDGETYGLSSYSAMYSQRLFIDGKEYPAVGVPGKTADTTVPMTKHYTVYFTPNTKQVEIVIQFANFNHYDYGGIVPVYLGTQYMITARDMAAQQRIHILFGCTLTAFLFFLGIFFFFRRRYSFLWFSLASLSIGIRMLIVEEKIIMLLFPNLPWGFSIALEYLALIALILSFLLYINSVFTGALNKNVLRFYGVLCALYAIAVLLTPPLIYTRFILWFQLCSAIVGIYVLAALVYNVVHKNSNRHMEHFLILSGSLIFIVMSIMDIQIHRSGGYSIPLGLSEIGMMVMIFINMIALVLQFSRTEKELDMARQHELEMRETNLLLDRMSRLKSDFLANISHEMRTPLTVMSSYAGLTSLEIRRSAVNEKTLDNLAVIKREAVRMADLVEQLKEVSLEKQRELALADTEALSLLSRAADFCGPICQKNKNKLIVNADSGGIILRVNSESIFQVLINLIINANRHTREGIIRLAIQADPENGFAIVSIIDEGEGIDPKRLPDLFKRGVSGDGSSGLGLPISREIVEEHGGRIWIVSDKKNGTVVRFTIPLSKGEEHNEKNDHTDC